MITRTFGRILRGKATPFQLFSACVLGSVLGFMPGFGPAAGLILLFTLLLIVLNANLPLAGLVGVAAKLVSLLIMPVTFAVGRFLLDGPLQGLFQSMINAPVLALFGFEYYATSGGLLLGMIFGLIAGVVVVKIITGFRRKMASLEKGSEKYRQYMAKKWVKLMIYVFVGGGTGKATYDDLLAKKVGNPIRPLGAVFAVLVVALLLLAQMFAAGPIVTMVLQSGLERVNGATVDIEGSELSLRENRFTLTGLAMADPNALETDLFRAAKLEADVSGASLLRKRLQLDRLVVSDGSSGLQRRAPGHLVGRPPEPVELPPSEDPEVKTLEDYLRDAKVWKERLAQARRWMEKMSGPEAEVEPEERKETLRERLEREVREKGYARVRADHLIEGSPTFTITELIAEKVRVSGMEGETIDINGKNLSTHPGLLRRTPEIKVTSSANTLDFMASLGQFDTNAANNVLSFNYRGLPTEKVAGDLKLGGTQPLQGGTIDLAANGQWTTKHGVWVDLPLQITLRDVTLALPELSPTKVDQLLIPVGVTGPLDNPRLRVDQKLLTEALVKAGASKIADELKGKATEAIGKEIDKNVGKTGRDLLRGILGGEKKEGDE
jgi:uncharacterized protein (TIGR03546 family)